jgi:hypothetical protein
MDAMINHRGAGLDPLDNHGADHERHDGIGRDPQGEHRDERRLRTRVVGRLRRGDSFDGPFAELSAVLRNLFLYGVGGKRAKYRSTSREYADRRANYRPAQNGRQHALPLFPGRQQVADFCNDDRALAFGFEVADDLTQPEYPHRDRHEINPVSQLGYVECETQGARCNVGPHQPQN